MKTLCAAMLALTVMSGGSAVISLAAATPAQAVEQNPQASKATDASARRRIRHPVRYAARRYDPVYYDRPYYYAPAPFFPFLGLGYGPLW
jgi:hypothetical protein